MKDKLLLKDMILRYASSVIISDNEQPVEPKNLFDAATLVLTEMLFKGDEKFMTEHMENIVSKMIEKGDDRKELKEYKKKSSSFTLFLSLLGENYLIVRTIFTIYLTVALKISLGDVLDYPELVPTILGQSYINTNVDDTQFAESYKSGLEHFKRILNESNKDLESLSQEILGNVTKGIYLYLEKREYDEAAILFAESIKRLYLSVEIYNSADKAIG